MNIIGKTVFLLLLILLPWAGRANIPDSTAIRAGLLEAQLRQARQQHNTPATAQALYTLGTFHLFETKNDAMVLATARQLLAVAIPARDSLHLARAYQLLAILQFHKKTSHPVGLLDQALVCAQRANHWQTLTEVCQVSADIAVYYKDYRRAEPLYHQAMAACAPHDPDTWLMTGLDYCLMLQIQGRAREAQALARKLDQMRPRLRKTNGPFVYANDMARLATYLGQYDRAETLLLAGLAAEQARPRPDSLHLYYYFQNLAELYVRQGNYKKAYERAIQHTAVQLWLQQVRQSREADVTLLRWKNTTEMARKETQIRQLAGQQQRQQILLAGVSVVALLATAFVLLLRRSHRRIERQRAELSQINATKNRLFSVVSHDLRGPVLTLRQSLDRLDRVPPAARPEAMERLRQSVNGLVLLTDNLLLYALAELDGLTTHLRPVGLAPLLANVLNLYREPIREKQLTVTGWPLPANVPDWPLLADETQAEIALRNVWQNAVKFSPVGGQLMVSIDEQARQITVQITDQGPGFSWPPPAEIAPTGTGLGLQVVQDLMARNNGSLRVDPGPTGTTVSLTWARSPAAKTNQHIDKTLITNLIEHENTLYTDPVGLPGGGTSVGPTV